MIKRFLFLILIFFSIASLCKAGMILQNLDVSTCTFAAQNTSTYTETDPNSKITLDSATKVSWAELYNNAQSMVVRDRGAGYFSGDFTARFQVYWSADTFGSRVVFWGLANEATGVYPIVTGGAENDDAVLFRTYNDSGTTWLILDLISDGAGSINYDYWSGGTDGNLYYVTITRDDDAGVNGTGQYKAYICTTAYCVDGANLQDTLTVDSPAGEQNDYRYEYWLDSWDNASGTHYTSGYMQDLEDKLCID